MSDHPLGHEFILAQLQRRVALLLRYGTVTQVDHAGRHGPRVRVRLGDGLETWAPMPAPRAGQNRTWNPLQVGEQVMVANVGGDTAQPMILGSVYRDQFGPPSDDPHVIQTRYADGSVHEVNTQAKTHTLWTAGDGEFRVHIGSGGPVSLVLQNDRAVITVGAAVFTVQDGTASVTCPTIVFDGNVTIGGNLVVDGTVDASGDVTAGSVSLQNHRHGQVRGGFDVSGTPIGQGGV